MVANLILEFLLISNLLKRGSCNIKDMSLLDTVRDSENKAADQHYERIKSELFLEIEQQPFMKSYYFKVGRSHELKNILMKRFTDDGFIVSDDYDSYYYLTIKIPH